MNKTTKWTAKPTKALSNKKELNKLCLKIRQCDKYKAWRQAVIDRDKEMLKNLQVHHKDPFRDIILRNNITSVTKAKRCKELWVVDNGITITKGEHRILSLIERYKYHTKGFFIAAAELLKEQYKKRQNGKKINTKK